VDTLRSALREAQKQAEQRDSDADLGHDIRRNTSTVKAMLAGVAAIVVATCAALAFLEVRTGSVIESAIASGETRAMVAEIAHGETKGYALQSQVSEHEAEIRYLRAALPRIETKLDDVLERLPRRAP
jgi:septal ring factor EnvC (AmiA/AmiB activator)